MNSKKIIGIIIALVILCIGGIKVYDHYQVQSKEELKNKINSSKLSDSEYNQVQENYYLNDEQINNYSGIFDNMDKSDLDKENLTKLYDSLNELYKTALDNVQRDLEQEKNEQISRINKIGNKDKEIESIKKELIGKRGNIKIKVDKDKSDLDNLKNALKIIKDFKESIKEIEDLEKKAK